MLWDRPDLATLRSFATACTPLRGGDGHPVEPERWTLRFPRDESPGEKGGVLPATYTKKSLVIPFGEPLYGEISVLECLRRDGWSGVWVDTFHAAFWRYMPERSSSIDLSLKAEAFRVYAGIIAEPPGGAHSCFLLSTRGRGIGRMPTRSPGSRRRSGSESCPLSCSLWRTHDAVARVNPLAFGCGSVA
jgi:hypothetical protein